MAPGYYTLASFSKPRWYRQRGHHQTKVLMNRTMAMHERYKSLYGISLPSSAKQRREMTKFCISWRTRTTAANFFCFEANAGVTYLALVSSETKRRTVQIK